MSCSLQCRIYTSKGFQDDWSQVNNMQTFTDKTTLMRMDKEISKLDLKLLLKKIMSKIYAKS